jgi:hypothetical protein
MNPIELLKKANTVLVFVLLVGTILVGGYLINRSRMPTPCVHVAIDSARINNK